MKIQSVSRDAFEVGHHLNTKKMVCIQIADVHAKFPVSPLQDKFLFCTRVNFEDTEDERNPFAISKFAADEIAATLLEARDMLADVVVHCNSGIYRSGAVVRVAESLGYEVDGTTPAVNILVVNRIKKSVAELIEIDSRV